MRVTSIVLAAGLALFANAQTTAGNTTPSQTLDAATAAQSSAQAEAIRCLDACDVEDVTCRAKCVAVSSPGDKQATDTVNCITACPIGKGTEADNIAYTQCNVDCLNNPSSGSPQPTGGASSGNGNGDSNSGDDDSNGDSTGNDDATGTGDNEGTQTSDGPSPSESTGGAALFGASSGVVGVLGFVAAVMAL